MKLASWNVNGIRACSRGGFLDWMKDEAADIVNLQEIKARPEQLEDEFRNPLKYHAYWHPAEKLGYSGVATFSKKEALDVQYGIGDKDIDREGRVLLVKFKDFTVVNTYFPNSKRDHSRLPFKLAFCKKIHKKLDGLRKKGENLLICGDLNIAHTEIDLKNPKTNKDNAGFLPEERAWMDRFLKSGYTDVFRHFNKEPGNYTWWSYRPGVRAKNVGWRLDYFIANAEFNGRLKSMDHHTKVLGSDHCPVVMNLKR